MAKTSKRMSAPDPVSKSAVIYARVSSKEQEKEGFSIPAQLKLLREYAAAQGLVVAEEYMDIETAKQRWTTLMSRSTFPRKGWCYRGNRVPRKSSCTASRC
jgi:predicted site-specific integrase-resolvase